MPELSVRRAADRVKIATMVEELAESLGATVTRDSMMTREREIYLKVSVPGGAYLPVSISGDSPHPEPNTFVCTWNTECDSLFAFSGRMGNVNPFHFAKATRVAYSVDGLLHILRADIPLLLNGDGHSPERSEKLARGRIDRLQRNREYIAPLVAAGLPTTNVDGTYVFDSPEQLRRKFEAIPAHIAALESFIAAGCPMERAMDCKWA